MLISERIRTGKGFFNIDHLPRARLHEAASPAPGPVQAVARADASFALEVAFVAGHDLDGHGFDEFEFVGAEAAAVALE